MIGGYTGDCDGKMWQLENGCYRNISPEINERLHKARQAVIDGCYVVNRGGVAVVGCNTAKASRLIDAIIAETRQSKKL